MSRLKKLIYMFFLTILLSVPESVFGCSAGQVLNECAWKDDFGQCRPECVDASENSPSGGSSSNVISCDSCGNACWDSPYNFGMRLTVLDKKGNEVTKKSYDFLYTQDSGISKYKTIPDKGSKIDYINKRKSRSDFTANYDNYHLASEIKVRFSYEEGYRRAYRR